MKLNTLIFLFSCISISLFSQIKGKVVDENNLPVPYVNIVVEHENIGTSSDVDGTFSLAIKEGKTLFFSALGYEKKKISASENMLVVLPSTTYELGEVSIVNKKETKQIEIGKSENSLHQAFENGPKFDAKFFPYQQSYAKTKFIKKISIFTENALEEASVKIHFYEVNPDGLPGDELLEKDYIVSVKKGSRRTWFDLSKLNLIFPKKGLFVAVERLFIEKNKLEKIVATADPNKPKSQRVYYPLPFYSFVDREYTYTFMGGSWQKESKKDSDGKVLKTKVFEPAIHLILTN